MNASKVNHTPKIVAISSDSYELAAALAAANPDIAISTKYTTRPLHLTEKEFFKHVSHKEFRDLLNSGYFAETRLVGENMYGTPKEAIEEALAVSKIAVVLDCDYSSYMKLQTNLSLPLVSWKNERSIFVADSDPNAFYSAACRYGDGEIIPRLESVIRDLEERPISYDAVFLSDNSDIAQVATDILNFIYDKNLSFVTGPSEIRSFCAELQKRVDNAVPVPPDALLRAHTPSLSKQGEALERSKEEIVAKYRNLYDFSLECSTYLRELYELLGDLMAEQTAENINTFYDGCLPQDNFRTLIRISYKACSKTLGAPPPSGLSLDLQFRYIEREIESVFSDSQVFQFLKEVLSKRFSDQALDTLGILLGCMPETWFHQLRCGETIGINNLAYEYTRVLAGLKEQIETGIAMIDKILKKEEAALAEMEDDI